MNERWMMLALTSFLFAIKLIYGATTPRPPTIVGGDVAPEDAWPWQVAIRYKDQFLCGGTLLRADIVLTAAHCTRGRRKKFIEVKVGEYELQKNEMWTRGEMSIKVNKIIVHPDYDDVKYPNDLSIIKLDRCVKFNKYITTIPQLADDGMDFINKPCYVTGWGVYDRNVFRLADILQEAKVPVITNAQCQPGILKNITITEDMICTEDNIRGGCFSDSGGPLQCLINQKWVHVGTVSWGNPSCNGLTVYARTSYFRDWILWTMEKISKSN